VITSRLIEFDPDDTWIFDSDNADRTAWTNQFGDIASIHEFRKVPDLVAMPDESGIDALRDMYRKVLANVGGIVVVEPIAINSIKSLRTIIKLPQKPHGMTYISAITIPFDDRSYVLRFQCPEIGTTGARDAAVAIMRMDTLKTGPDGFPQGWIIDPYSRTETPGARFNLSDEEQYDAMFPDHPLSRARRYVVAPVAVLKFKADIATLKGFTLARKPW